LASDLDLMLFAFRDHGKSRQMALVVQQQMQLHGSFRPAELGPVEYRRAQIDHRDIQTHQLVLKAESPLGVGAAGRQGLALLEQLMERRLVHLPRAMLVGIGQGGTGVALRVTPDAAIFLPKPPSPRKSPPTTWRSPNGKRAWPRTGPNKKPRACRSA